MKVDFQILTVLLLSLISSSLIAEKKDSDTQKLTSIRKLLSSKSDRKEGLKALLSLSRSKKEGNLKFKATALLSEIYRKEKKLDRVSQIVSSYDEFDRISKQNPYKYKATYLEPFLESAHFKAINPKKSQVQSAFEMLNYAEEQTAGLEQVKTLFKYGEVLRDLDKFKRCETYLKRALETGNKHFSKKGYEPGDRIPGIDEWRVLKRKIEDLLFLLRFDLLASEYGELYALYVRSRTHYDRKEFKKCQEVCSEILEKGPDCVYGAAAQLYHAYCTGKLGDYPKAEKELHAFIKKAPHQVYRGKAWMELGRIQLEENWNATKAEEYYKKGLEWFRYVRARKDAVEIYTVPEKVRTISKPVDKLTGLNGWNRRTFRKIAPEEVVNHSNSDWYINEYEKQCVVMAGFFTLIDGDSKKAKEYFSRVGALDSDLANLEANQIFNALTRLKAAANVGRMTFTKAEKKPLKNPKTKLLIGYAELNYLMERFERAKQLYKSVYTNPKSTKYEKAIAYVGYGAVCDVQGKEFEKEVTCYQNAIALLKKNQPIHENALWRLCCADIASPSDSDELFKNFKLYFSSYPDGKYAEDLYRRKIQFLISYQEYEQVRPVLELYVRKYPDIEWVETFKYDFDESLIWYKKNSPNSAYYKGLENDFEKYLKLLKRKERR